MMINTFDVTLNEMYDLCGREFTQCWSDFINEYYNDIQNGNRIPGHASTKVLLRYCLAKSETFDKRNKCIVVEFMFSFMIMYPAFVRHHDRFYQVALNKAHELLEENYLHQGEAPQCVRILHRFIEVFE